MGQLYLISGSDTVNARRKFVSLKQTFNNANFIEIDLSAISLNELIERLQLTDMFNQTVFVFENFSLISKDFWVSLFQNLNDTSAIFNAIGKSTGRIPSEYKKQLKIFSFDTRTEIFDLLNTIDPGKIRNLVTQLEKNLETVPEPVIMTMIQNRIRDLIIIKSSPDSFSGLAWQKFQLQKQAENFSLNNLIKLYRRLLSLEIREKTSANPDSYSSHFVLDLISLS